MRVLTILVAVGIIAGALGETPECLQATADFDACTKQAYADYKTVFQAGDDKKKPAWLARKSCNYLTNAMKCGEKLIGTCHTEDEMIQQKDEQIAANLETVTKFVQDWDSSLCPVVREYQERLQAASEPESAANKTPEADPTGSSTTMTASVLSTFILAIFL